MRHPMILNDLPDTTKPFVWLNNGRIISQFATAEDAMQNQPSDEAGYNELFRYLESNTGIRVVMTLQVPKGET